ncbi:hypothetical protein [Corynebacterium falsenii]|uniref:hypothetical protein n=1 Tax=Corynebacterium falsenii TaxID=108486 RepID=UPI0004B75EBA|nr:hypothetical protein [Corynebacterium falsenii]MDC7104081.1 hypothetical protein [Corynebacterium falsenii]UBI04821.1 hypothetical protein LA343_01145 [Corynebacterium falsenii]UBI07201.1 hypothetical protein LA329_02525 [Corynebacterium falsenii]HJF12896.1 hypothetical protein [Corynebacterium falsenii]
MANANTTEGPAEHKLTTNPQALASSPEASHPLDNASNRSGSAHDAELTARQAADELTALTEELNLY